MQMSRHSQLRNAVCADLCTVWKKDCASRHAALGVRDEISSPSEEDALRARFLCRNHVSKEA